MRQLSLNFPSLFPVPLLYAEEYSRFLSSPQYITEIFLLQKCYSVGPPVTERQWQCPATEMPFLQVTIHSWGKECSYSWKTFVFFCAKRGQIGSVLCCSLSLSLSVKGILLRQVMYFESLFYEGRRKKRTFKKVPGFVETKHFRRCNFSILK